MGKPIDLTVNGKRYSISSDPEATLLQVLRDELGLTGTKYGCGEGQCGACTVLLGGTARRSCQLPVGPLTGQSITTIEGLERDGKLHPLQQAFIDVGAFQCAYCTPGMIMSGAALLQQNSHPSRQQIAHALDGNICRCGTYPRILEAVERASAAINGGAR
ncbi:MAG: ferredoxin [Proteobacteria bacterium]|nr:MAG: ferredoxin [Pseudomonadota bacterium]